MIGEYSTIVETAAPKVQYLTADHLGSPRINTDQNGSVISRRDFMPFGEETFTPQRVQGLGYQSDDVRQKFTGYENDLETGLEFAQARMYSSGLGRFSGVDPYNIILEIKAESDSENASRKLQAYLTRSQQWNRYAYVTNNPLVFVDPSGEVLKLTGSADDNEKFLQLFKEMLGEKAAKNLTYEVTDQGEWIIDYKGPGGLDIGGEFGVALQDIIDASEIVTMRLTIDNLYGWAGSKTALLDNNRDISIKINYDGVNAAETAFKGTKGTDGRDLKFTMSILMAHELGHAWGMIRDQMGKQLDNLRFYESDTSIRRQNDDRAVRLENIERARLGLGRKYNH